MDDALSQKVLAESQRTYLVKNKRVLAKSQRTYLVKNERKLWRRAKGPIWSKTRENPDQKPEGLFGQE